MEEIVELLIELLKKHNRVSLPGMGAFVASPQAATVDKGKIMPPTKKVAFVKTEIWNDGLLEQLYATRHEASVEDAREKLYRIIADIRFELDSSGKVTLPGLGMLRQTASRDVTFGLVKNLNLRKDSYGLDEVKIAPDKTPESAERSTKLADKKSNVPLLVLLFIILAAIAAIALFLLLSHIHDNNNLEALITTQVAPQPISDVPPEQGTPNSDPDEAAKQPTLPKADEPALVAEPPQVTPRCEFCTVVASFNTLEGARVKEQKYKSMGYKPRVVSGGNNRYRVMLGCYPTVDAAKKGLTEAAKFVKDAWVLEVCK